MAQPTLDGRAVAFADDGQGSPVIAFHSSGMSSRQWSALSTMLAPTHRVLRPDFWGAGATAAWPAGRPFDYGDDVALGEALLVDATKDGGTADLVGHSYGGLVALQIALRQPGRVRRVAVYEPVAFGAIYSLHDEAAIADMTSAETAAQFSDPAIGGTEVWLEKFIDFWNGPGAWKLLPSLARAGFVKNGAQVFAEVRSLLADRTTHQRYAEIVAPTLFIDGERSPPMEKRLCAALASVLPQARLQTLPGAGHMGPLTHTAAVNQRIVDHLVAV